MSYTNDLYVDRIERLPGDKVEAFWERAIDLVAEFKAEEATDINNGSLHDIVEYLGDAVVGDLLVELEESSE